MPLKTPGIIRDAAELTIDTGGLAQDAFNENIARAYLFIMNPADASEELYVNIGADAAADTTSYPLAAGASLSFESTFIPKGRVSVYAATTAHEFIAKEGA